MPRRKSKKEYSSIVNSGTCGYYLTWVLDKNGKLTISGSGTMDDYSFERDAPWNDNRDSIISVDICSGVTSIGAHAFYSCENLTHIVIPDEATSVGEFAFGNCTGLQSVVIPNAVTFIGDWAFDSCDSLEKIHLPDSLVSIGYRAFESCSALKSIRIPSSVVSIGDEAFTRCTSLTDLMVSSSNTVYSAENGALYNKDKTCLIAWPAARDNVSIPGSVSFIGDYAFWSCTYLKSLNIPGSVTSIGEAAFGYCENLQNLSIPGSVASIGNFAFSGCETLPSVTILSNLMSIGRGAFSGCSSLTNIYVSSGNTFYSEANGALYNKNMTELIAWPAARSNVVIPDGVTSIGDFAFDKCHKLQSVILPGSITSIGFSAFDSCKNLKTIAIPNSVASIGDSAFSNCDSLKNLTIPCNVQTIGDWTFSFCANLSSITFEGNAPDIDEYAFSGTGATVHYPAGNPTWTDTIRQNYEGTIHWVPYTPKTEPTVNAEAGNTMSDSCEDHITWSVNSSVVQDNTFDNRPVDFDQILAKIFFDYPDALNDRKKLVGLLMDLIPQEKLVRNTIILVFDEGIAAELKEKRMLDDLTFHRYKKILIDGHGISDSLAEQAIRIWIHALGINSGDE